MANRASGDEAAIFRGMSEASDDQLLELVKIGDEKAMDQLLARHEQKIYRFGLCMCGNEDDARDVLQETLLAASRTSARFAATRSSRRGSTRWHAASAPSSVDATRGSLRDSSRWKAWR